MTKAEQPSWPKPRKDTDIGRLLWALKDLVEDWEEHGNETEARELYRLLRLVGDISHYPILQIDPMGMGRNVAISVHGIDFVITDITMEEAMGDGRQLRFSAVEMGRDRL